MGQVALQVRTPQPDLAAITQAAQGANARDYELQNAPARSELEALKLQDEIGGQSALAGYRQAQTAGQPDAINKLNAYPQIQKQVYEAFDGMKPEEYIFAKKKAQAFGRAAQYVLSLQKGSPEQKQAWDESLNVLQQEGFIDDTQHKRMIQSGPSDLVLQQALTVDDYVKRYAGKNSKVNDAEYEDLKRAKIRAEIEKINTEIKTGGKSGTRASQNSLLIAANRELGEWEKNIGGTPEETAAKKAEIWKRFGLPSDELPLTQSGAGKTDQGGPAAPEAAAAPATGAIPPGAIDYLKQHPDLAAEFDAKYGEGASKSIIGGQ